jgi:iron(III) transport system substrate-binding protein
LKSTCILLGILVGLTGCGAKPDVARSSSVVIYVSEGQVFSEPVLKDFEKETGIHVKAAFDTEEAKSTGNVSWLSRIVRRSP